MEGYKSLSGEAKKQIGGSPDPFYMAFMTAVMGAWDYVRDGGKISLVLDDDEETAEHCLRFYRRIRKVIPNAREKLVAITFADDEVFVPIQAADFVSSLVRFEARRRFFGWPYDYQPLLTYLDRKLNPATKLQWFLSFYDKEQLMVTGRELEAAHKKKVSHA